MSEAARCPQCQGALPADAPAGLCPECLLKQGMESGVASTAGGESTPRFIPPPPEELAGRFPQLEILSLLGKGGMGAVYKARQPKLDRLVAVKILAPEVGEDPAFAERFSREAKALARLSHPHIVTVHEIGEVGGLYYFVMEYVDGVNLRQMIHDRRLSPQEALAIVPQLCEALQFAHDEGVVHRDIKPENILVDKRGRVKIADFGLAKLIGRPPAETVLTEVEQIMGTLHYMAPEQLETPREIDHRADIYSLGVVFYEMLTGQLPLGRFPPPSTKVEVDVRLDEVVLRLLEQDLSRRYQHASDVKIDVESIGSSSAKGFGPKVRVHLRRGYDRSRSRLAWLSGRMGDWFAHRPDSSRWRSGVSHAARWTRDAFGGTENLRMGGLSLAALVLGLLMISINERGLSDTPIPYLFILLGFCLSRAGLALVRGTATAAQKWLLYPALVPVYLGLAGLVILWPVVPLLGATSSLDYLAREYPQDLGWLDDLSIWVLGFYMVAAGLSLWWTILGLIVWRRPEWISNLFHPFAEDFSGRSGLWVAIAALLVAIACVFGGVHFVWGFVEPATAAF